MILSKEMILTLTCLKTVGVKGVGPKKIFSIGKIIANEGSNVKDVKDLLFIMERMNEKVIKEITLGQLERAYDHSRRIIEASKNKNVELIGFYDDMFPSEFRDTVDEKGKQNPPLLLWYRGDLTITLIPQHYYKLNFLST